MTAGGLPPWRAGLRRWRGRTTHTVVRTAGYPLLRRAPLRDVVLFESWQGTQYSDSPRAISEELGRRGTDLTRVWVTRGSSDLPADVLPDDVVTVRRWSPAHYDLLARARYLVTNDTLPPVYTKRPGSTLLQTWHGTPLKRIGFDLQTIHFRNQRYLDELAREVAAWDYLVSPSAYCTEVLRRAFRYDGEVLETGYPRNDLLASPDADAVRRRVRERLGVGAGTRVVLWAPTWRDDEHAAQGYRRPDVLDLDAMAASLGEDHLLLVRAHHLVARSGDRLPDGPFVRDVSDCPDVRELYAAADVLVTDYSSVMFDFAVTGRPMLFLAWDLEHYRDTVRGFYLDYDETVPGPVLRDTKELIDALRDLDAVSAAHAERYAAFRARFCALEDGAASARVVEAVFAR